MHAYRNFIVSKFLTVLVLAAATIPSVPAAAAPSDKFDALCERLIGGGAGGRIRSRFRQAINFSMEAALRHKLGEDWRKELLKSEILDWNQKNLSNAELAYLANERRHVVTAAPVKKLNLSQNPKITDIKILKDFIGVLGGKIEDLDISNLALAADYGTEDVVDDEDAESYFRMHDFLAAVNQLNPGIQKLAISHISGTYLNSFRNMLELQELDIHNSHFRTPVNSFVFRKHDPSGSISTQRWRTFLMQPPAKLKKLIIPNYFNNADENLQQAEELAARVGIELIKRDNFSNVLFDDTDWVSLQDRKLALQIDGRRVLVGMLSTVLPPANSEMDGAKNIHRAVSNYIFWHLSVADQIALANVQYLEDGSLYANVKYRIGTKWYSLSRELQGLGVSYGQHKPLSQDEWRHINWNYSYQQKKANVDRWSRVSP